MSSLTGNLISTSYPSLLKTADNTPLSASLIRVTDGLGNLSALALSTGSIGIYGNTQLSGSLSVIAQDVDNNSIYTEGGIIAGRQGYLNPADGGYTEIIHTDTITGGMTVVRPTTTDNVYRNFVTNAFYISTAAPAGSGSIYIQPSGLDSLIVRASSAISGSRAVSVQVTGSINTTGTVSAAGLSLTGSASISGSLKFATSSSFTLPVVQPASPVAGTAFFSGSFLYIYNGSAFVSASFN